MLRNALGHYSVRSLLVRGRLSVIYLAQHPAQKSTAALTTFILPERFTTETRSRFTQRFTKEAAALTSLSHRNLLAIYEYGEQFGYPYLVTPYMTNGSLADILKQRGRCTATYVLEVLEQVAAGLDYAHRKGIIHGTLKPSNILLGDDQNLLVAGFGLVNMLQIRGIEQNDQPYFYLLSIADTFLYASTYIAPEVVQGQPIDVRSDIYALGVMLFELLSGKPPFTGTSPLDTAMQHIHRPLPSLHKLCPDIPIAMELVINHALEHDPNERFQRVSELVEAFSQVCKGSLNHSQSNFDNDNMTMMNELKLSNDLHPIPEEEISMGGWQIMPPIITGKLSTVRASNGSAGVPGSAAFARPLPITTDSWQIIPPIVTGRIAAVRSSQQLPTVKPPVVPQSTKKRVQQVVTQNDAAPQASKSAPSEQYGQPAPLSQHTANSSTISDADAMNTPAWWVRTTTTSPLASATETELPEGPLRVPNPEQKKLLGQSDTMPASDAVMRIRPAKRARGMGRRQAIATLAAGGVVAAGALVAVKLNLAHLVVPSAPHITQSGTTAPSPPKKQTGNGGTGNPGKTGAGHTGTVLGTTDLAVNSSMNIVNPADGKNSLLIHLPNGHFVAYERACTHVGVEVNYDPATHTLVCPAHGAVFDPLNNAAVLQGPGWRPLTSVTIRINADGTITTG